jgi:DSF synthase
MATVIADLGAHRSSLSALRHRISADDQPKDIRLNPDYRRSTLWVELKKSAPRHISTHLLSQLLVICEAQKGLQTSPFRFRVLSSESPETFSLGGDLALFKTCISRKDRASLTRYALDAVKAIYENCSGSGYSDLTTIAVARGEAQGGGFEAALSSHILIAERGASFGFPEGLFGMYPGMGGRVLLSLRCGPDTANRIIGSVKRWRAEELFELGVIDILAEPGKGKSIAKSVISESSEEELSGYRSRFRHIRLGTLQREVIGWVGQALSLSARELRVMDMILKAQKEARNRGALGSANTSEVRI